MNREELLEKLNPAQRDAVLAVDGPVLILAGAGSGKTRVLVHRIAYMIDELGILPGNILAITFTNKAADEMRSRVDSIIGAGSELISVSTFHSLCVRILRRNAELLGFTRYFTIYDSDDQVTLMKGILKRRNIDPKKIREKSVLAAISSAKDELISPEKFRMLNQDFFAKQVADLYEEYQRELKENNAMDFDDLICKTVELFEQNPDVLSAYQDRYRYLMIDEYQDTNTAQFRFVSLLAARYRNLCVVGDDDQSIYKFRGANIRNILGFEKVFPDAHVVKLEQNYRSTASILNAANEVIRHNHGRKAKKLWTENPDGEKVALRRFATGFEEAEYAAAEIRRAVRSGARSWKDFAILYRTNAQSRLFEEKFIMSSIPYRIVGGVNFYSRKEIKDILAYLKTIDNGVDALSVHRIINVPKRGIGGATISKVEDYAEFGGISFFDGITEADRIPGLSSGAAKKLIAFSDMIRVFRTGLADKKISDVLKDVIDTTGYVRELEAEDTEEAEARIDNINELISKAVQYEENADDPTLSGFLEEVALIADIDSVGEEDDRVLLMTLHSAKGLEFPVVYMAGMEDGLFPSSMSINADDAAEEIEEERRLAYVGITRAKEQLTLTCAKQRMVRGDIISSPLSRFVREIPRDLIDLGTEMPAKQPQSTPRGLDRGMAEALSGKPFGKTFDPKKEPAYGGPSTYKNPYTQTAARAAAASGAASGSAIDYKVGDRVQHVKFGVGVVKNIEDGGRDHLVTVDFQTWGVKKLYAAFAKLQKL